MKNIIIIISASFITVTITLFIMYNVFLKDLLNNTNLTDNECIKIIKNSNFYGFPDKKIGPYFNAFFSNPEWKCVRKPGKLYVIFQGDAYYFGKYVRFKITFDVNKTIKTKTIQPISYYAGDEKILYTDFLNLINTIFMRTQ
ncbi:hypothetical protein XO10_08725 [Marinitoga sp. 1135]|nr:hypothetical protein LN42_09405 [Marinitoga sp. 1137]NUU96335.1 hypothetical protein [Marinitoga sp. 1135]